MKRKSSKFVALICTLLFLQTNSAIAATKVPNLNTTNSFAIPQASEVVTFSRLQDKWVIAGIDGDDKSWIALLDQQGSEIWRSFPLLIGKGGDGFVTAVEVDSSGILVSGLSQNPIVLPANQSADVVPTNTPSATPNSTITSNKNVPLVNPDNVTPSLSNPLRKDIKNIFLIRINQSGNLESVWNSTNAKSFIPNSIASVNNFIFISGNITSGDNKSQGALYKFDSSGLIDSYIYGENQTTFNKVIAISKKNLNIVGSSGDTIAQRKVVGKSDGIILTIAPTNGEVVKILRSSAKGGIRSWDSASGNLLVAGTSQVGSTREGVVTSFTSKGALSWTTRFPKSAKTLATGNCIANGVAGADVLLYLVDTKGKQIKAGRLPKQNLVALASTPTKGCAVLTAAAASGIRMSFL